MRNITKWGPKVVDYLKKDWQCYDVVGLCEHHRGPEDMSDLGNDITKAGWRPVLSPAMPRDNIEKAGGALLAVKRGLNARSFAHLASDVS
eukprot:6495050-Pyramimonas_sp.AAC.1